jgi:hypothetical protein
MPAGNMPAENMKMTEEGGGQSGRCRSSAALIHGPPRSGTTNGSPIPPVRCPSGYYACGMTLQILYCTVILPEGSGVRSRMPTPELCIQNSTAVAVRNHVEQIRAVIERPD